MENSLSFSSSNSRSPSNSRSRYSSPESLVSGGIQAFLVGRNNGYLWKPVLAVVLPKTRTRSTNGAPEEVVSGVTQGGAS